MSQINTSQAKMMINSKLLLVCFLIVIVSLLSALVVPTTGKERVTQTSSSAPIRGPATATSETGGQTPDKTSNKLSQTDAPPPHAAKVSNNKTEQQASNNHNSNSNNNNNNNRKCEYEKGQWDECEANGAQQTKVMRLKWGGPECKPTKTIRRDCKAKGEVGCKYARGEWSNVCQAGLRVRVDTLVGPVTGVQANELARANRVKCKPQRRVTKDCRRTCHYTKSGWSECSNGFRTRVLTLADQVDGNSNERGDESLGFDSEASVGNGKQPSAQAGATNQTDNQICVRQKLIRRKCTSAESKTAGRAPAQQQQRENSQQASGASSNLTPAQRRRLKQLQLKQQQQQQSSVTTSGSTQPSTARTTTNKVRTASGGESSLTSRGGGSSTTTAATTSAASAAAAADRAGKTTTATKSGRR